MIKASGMRRLLFSPIPCVGVSGNVPVDAMKLVDRAGGKRVTGPVYMS